MTQSKSRLAARLDLVRPLFAADIALAGADPLDAPPAPLPEEAACLSPNAVQKRRREFAAGRAAARQAMRHLGAGPQPVLAGADRAPVWPEGLTGSISHTRSCAMAVLAPAKAVQGLGIDLEEDTPLKEDLVPAICTARERGLAAPAGRSRPAGQADLLGQGGSLQGAIYAEPELLRI